MRSVNETSESFPRRALILSASFAGVFAVAAMLWRTCYVLSPMIIGALFGIFLHELSRFVRRVVPLGEGWAVSLTLVLLLVVLVVAGYALGMRVTEQFSQLMDMLPRGLEAAKQWLARNPRLHEMLHSLGSGGGAGGGSLSEGLRGIGSMVKAGFSLGVAVFTAFFTGVFLAYSPTFYSRGVLRLIPEEHRPRGQRLLSDLWRSLWLWTLGRLLVMVAITVGHFVAYWLLGVPLPFTLAIIAGTLAFIPFLGPILATIPAGLVALTKSPSLMLWVIVVHALVQTLESHVLTPLTQKYMVDVPALVTIASFLAFGEMLGVMGIIVATPAAAALIVLVHHLYMAPVLGERGAISR